jgi:hypothetical protein
MFIIRNLLISTIILGLLSISTWFMPNCYLWSLFNVYSILHEPCFTFALLQCLAWIHFTQDIMPSMDLLTLPNIPTKTPNAMTLWLVLCFFAITSDTNMWCYQHQSTLIHQQIVLQIWHHPGLAQSLQLLGRVKHTIGCRTCLLCLVTPVTFLKS